ncbi:MAG: EamA family transporter [Thermoleophilaceae bacterium]
MVWAALATVYVVWGSVYLGIRVMVETVPPLLGGGLRFVIAGAAFLGVLRLASGAARVRVKARELAGAGVMGVLLPLGGNGLVLLAEQKVPSGLAALIVGCVPLWVALMRRAHGEALPLTTLGGVLIGFAGLAILVLPGDRPGNAPIWGVLLLVGASLSWAVGSFYSGRIPQPADAFAAAAWQMLLGGALLVAAGLLAGEAGDVQLADLSVRSLVAFAYLVAVAIVGFSAYVWLLRNAPISMVATYAFVNPVIAIFLGWAVLSEEVTPTTAVGAAIIVASVASVVRREAGGVAEPEPTQAR